MKAILAAMALALTAGAAGTAFDNATASRIAILHGGRVKPLDSCAREVLRSITGKERFPGYWDSVTQHQIEVFGDAEPVEAFLRLVAEPERFRALNFIRVDHPELKQKYRLDENRIFFSLRDFDGCREELQAESRRIDADNATSAQRALLSLIRKQNYVQAIFEERLLAIVPVPFGPTGGWMTPADLRIYFSEAQPTDPRFRAVKTALDEFLKKDPTKDREQTLRKIVSEFARVKSGLAKGEFGEVNLAVAGLAAALKAANPAEYPSDEDIDRELSYQKLQPFSLAAGVFALALLIYIGAYVFDSGKVWAFGVASQMAGIGMVAYGYALRWTIAGRYPLSNHYESMIMVAFGAGIISLIAELILRRRVFGLAGTTVSCLMILLAQTVPIFAEQSAISNLQPALQTFWMTIHVPIIMTGYAGAAIICVLGHIYLFTHILRRESPGKEAALEALDVVMYRALQVTVLFLLTGILLGAVWAGEAWGRPWGWDMKETWALITLIAYLVTLHGRFTGYVRGLGTALCALGGFMLVILCYYGVNFIFGKGLHTYGFGSGEIWPVVAFFIFEAVLMGASAAVGIARRRKPPLDAGTE
ncbi:MAG TPA: cytochrome c biogenesis protein CcsA [Planctomycetota bacterium]|nr:cytochrome c biogenesis protein CcsA [Planctomycetota bacterium]